MILSITWWNGPFLINLSLKVTYALETDHMQWGPSGKMVEEVYDQERQALESYD